MGILYSLVEPIRSEGWTGRRREAGKRKITQSASAPLNNAGERIGSSSLKIE